MEGLRSVAKTTGTAKMARSVGEVVVRRIMAAVEAILTDAKTIGIVRMDKSVDGDVVRRITAVEAALNVVRTMAIASKVKSVATVAALMRILVKTVGKMPIAVKAYNAEMVAAFRNHHLVAVEKRRTVKQDRSVNAVGVRKAAAKDSGAGMIVSAVMA